MNAGKNFDDKTDWFKQRIYGGMKGQLRLKALWQDMLESIPNITGESELTVWDAGGGLGQMSRRCAEQGHQVWLNDLSGEMLNQAKNEFAHDSELSQRITMSQQSIQDFAQLSLQPYDLVVCHAVLEWVEDAEQILSSLIKSIKPGGYLSLAFYNINSAVFMNVLKGNFKKALSGDFVGHPGSLTPPHPRHPEQVLSFLEAAGLEIVLKKPVRVAFDYLSRALRDDRSDGDIEEVESFLRSKPEFWALGRYVHLVAKKA